MAEGLPSIVEFSENIAEAEAVPPIPARDYPATIQAVEVKESGKGNLFAAVQFKVSPDDLPADYDPSFAPEGVTLTYNRIVMEDNPQSRYRLRKFCEAIGATASKRIDVNDWIGLSARLSVKHGTWEGETRAEIAKVDRLN